MEGLESRHTVLSNIAILIANALEHYSVDGRQVVESCGIDYEFAMDPETRIPFSKANILWAKATEVSEDDCFGLIVAERFNPSVLNGLGFSWLASSSLKEAFQRIMRFQKLINSGRSFGVEMDGANMIILPQKNKTELRYHHTYVLTLLGAITRMSRLTTGEDIDPVALSLMESMDGYEERISEFFRCPVIFSASRNSLSYSLEVIDREILTANPRLAEANDQLVIEYLQKFDKQSLVSVAQTKIVRMLPSGRPNQVEIAKQLNMSLRNFQRKLKQEGTSFSALVDGVRHELALRLIRDTNRSIGTISYSLGFSEPANFTRSFKSWTGVSPKAYRHQMMDESKA